MVIHPSYKNLKVQYQGNQSHKASQVYILVVMYTWSIYYCWWSVVVMPNWTTSCTKNTKEPTLTSLFLIFQLFRENYTFWSTYYPYTFNCTIHHQLPFFCTYLFTSVQVSIIINEQESHWEPCICNTLYTCCNVKYGNSPPHMSTFSENHDDISEGGGDAFTGLTRFLIRILNNLILGICHLIIHFDTFWY